MVIPENVLAPAPDDELPVPNVPIVGADDVGPCGPCGQPDDEVVGRALGERSWPAPTTLPPCRGRAATSTRHRRARPSRATSSRTTSPSGPPCRRTCTSAISRSPAATPVGLVTVAEPVPLAICVVAEPRWATAMACAPADRDGDGDHPGRSGRLGAERRDLAVQHWRRDRRAVRGADVDAPLVPGEVAPRAAVGGDDRDRVWPLTVTESTSL